MNLGMTDKLNSKLLCTLVVAVTGAGCSSGLVGARAFTPDSRYLIWEDSHYWPIPPSLVSEVKRTDCETGRTLPIGKGTFVLDKSGQFALLYPALDWPGAPTLVRIEDGRKHRLPELPARKSFYDPEWVDVTVGQFEPPEVAALLVSTVDRKFVHFRLKEDVWQVLEEGSAAGDLLRRAEDIQGQSAFKYEQVRTKLKETFSPDRRSVLIESARDPVYSSRLKNGNRTVLLAVQTDQLHEACRKIAEFIVYAGRD